MKKLIALLSAGILVFSFAGCGNEDIESSPDSIDSIDNEEYDQVVSEINMFYGDDEETITLYKPDDASFMVDAEDAEDAGDIVILLADDFSWDAEIMGYKYYEGIGSNVPFVDYYFCGAADSEEYELYEQEVIDLGIDFEENPVKLIRYTYKEFEDDEEYNECFVGFEYKGSDDCGLMGIKIAAFEEELSDSYIKDLFTQLFTPER